MAIAFILSFLRYDVFSGIFLMLSGIAMYFSFLSVTKNFLNSRGLFVLIWNVSIGLSCLKLHPLQTEWHVSSWIAFLSAAIFIFLGYDFGSFTKDKIRNIKFKQKFSTSFVFFILSIIVIFTFFVEIYFSRGIPFLSSNMSSYHEFGLSYLHYITVTSATIPSIAVVILHKNNIKLKMQRRFIILLSLICATIPFLIVSRQLILQMIIVFTISYCKVHRILKFKIKYALIAIAILLCSWFFITEKRNQSNVYLADVLKLGTIENAVGYAKLYQIYMYIAYNFDAFNDNIYKASFQTFGFSSLTPLWTFLGIKRIWLNILPHYSEIRSISVFNTSPFISTPYRDFGFLGILLYCFIVGYYVHYIEHRENMHFNNIYIIKKAIIDYCLMMSFFSCFFSNTMIWVQLITLSIFNSLTTDISA